MASLSRIASTPALTAQVYQRLLDAICFEGVKTYDYCYERRLVYP